MFSVPALRLLHVLRVRGTLTAAAEELHLSRSAASHQLAALQRAVGAPLTEKVGRRLRLTEVGDQLARHAARVLLELEDAEAVVERLRENPAGTVRLGAIQTIPAHAVAEVLTAVAREYPRLRVETHTVTTDEAVNAVDSGQLDIAVVQSYDVRPLRLEQGSRAVVLFRDPVRLLLPASHQLAHVDTVEMARLADEQWVAGHPGSYFGELVPALCRRAGFWPDIAHRSNDFEVVASLVAAGHGIAFIPYSANVGAWPHISVRNVDAPVTGRDVMAVLRTSSSRRPGIQAVVEALRAHWG